MSGSKTRFGKYKAFTEVYDLKISIQATNRQDLTLNFQSNHPTGQDVGV